MPSYEFSVVLKSFLKFLGILLCSGVLGGVLMGFEWF